MILLSDLHKTLGSKPVLRGVTLEVARGETLAVIGGSGCGKTVLLRHIIGFFRPDQGRVVVDGTNLTSLDRATLMAFRRRIGMVFQGAALFDSMNVRDNVAFQLEEHRLKPPDEVEKIVRARVRSVGLKEDDLAKMPSELSGGMRKRAGLARALAVEPPPAVMLYDEPTTGLDPIMSDVIGDLILGMAKEFAVTSVVVTHDMALAYKVGNRIAMLHEGRVQQIGTPDEIRSTANPIVRQFIEGRSVGPIVPVG
ncbi:MAG: ABC transporter ATP-binding protein [Planctomycetes bacterium]|nr:ABC transporter ATP-binding protein [Planctomycetota bacterium]